MRTQADWQPLDPARSRELADARLQIHHAAQLAAALGISYLPAQTDDSHTNLEWLPELGSLASKPVGPNGVRIAVRPHVFALLILDEQQPSPPVFLLNGRTIEGAVRWLRTRLMERGLDADRYTLRRHYSIPPHAVIGGTPFDATRTEHFAEISRWYADAALALGSIAATIPGSPPVRCWPHHFDIATLVDVAPGESINVGMEPGDDSLSEPYYYVSVYPSPGASASLPRLAGNGEWSDRDWFGAVLPGSRLVTLGQRSQVEEFLGSAVRACMSLLRSRRA